MAKIAVAAGGNNVYHVTVEEGTSRTTHEVTVTPDDVQRYAPGVAAEQLVEASFRFLLERRGRLEAGALTDVRDLLVTEAYEGNSGLNGRVAFGRDGKVYMSTGGQGGDGFARSDEPARQNLAAQRRWLRAGRQPVRWRVLQGSTQR